MPDRTKATWNRKEGSDAPRVGDSVRGELKPSGKGLKFTLGKEGQAYRIVSVHPGEPWSNEHGTFHPFDCEFEESDGAPRKADFHGAVAHNGQRRSSGRPASEINAIQRQHSQEMAIRVAALMSSAGIPLPADESELLSLITRLTDHYQADVSVQNGAGAAPKDSPVPAPESSEDDRVPF